MFYQTKIANVAWVRDYVASYYHNYILDYFEAGVYFLTCRPYTGEQPEEVRNVYQSSSQASIRDQAFIADSITMT